MGPAIGEAYAIRAISTAVRPHGIPVLGVVQGCSCIMTTGRDEEPTGLMSVDAIMLQIKSFPSVEEIREYTVTATTL
jgi:hypothetical protein